MNKFSIGLLAAVLMAVFVVLLPITLSWLLVQLAV